MLSVPPRACPRRGVEIVPTGARVIGARWAPTRKNIGNRARLVEQGCEEDEHEIRSDALTRSLTRLHLTLAVAAQLGWALSGYDTVSISFRVKASSARCCCVPSARFCAPRARAPALARTLWRTLWRTRACAPALARPRCRMRAGAHDLAHARASPRVRARVRWHASADAHACAQRTSVGPRDGARALAHAHWRPRASWCTLD